MTDNSRLLGVLQAVAESVEPLAPLAQEEMAQAASSSKSAAGDHVLAALARRTDISPGTRTIIEKSPRAAAKAAWLSRKDHPDGYVHSAVKKEKRATVLAAVAAHPDASSALIDILAATQMVAVASAIIDRDPDELSDEAVRLSVLTVIYSGQKVHQRHGKARDLLLARPQLWDTIASQVRDHQGVHFLLDTRGYVFPASELPRITSLLLASALNEIPVDSSRQFTYYGSPAYRYAALTNKLTLQPNWQSGSPEDLLVAQVIQKVRNHQVRLESGAEECFLRHFGTAKEQAEAEAKRLERLERIADAKVTVDDSMLKSYISSGDPAIVKAACINPNLKLQHLQNAAFRDRVPLILKMVDEGQDPVEAAALMIKGGYAVAPELDALLSDEDCFKASALGIKQSRHGESQISPYSLRAVLSSPRLVPGAVSQLRVTELANLLEYDYMPPEAKLLVAASVSRVLASTLGDSVSWKTFLSLAPQMDCPISESAQVATIV